MNKSVSWSRIWIAIFLGVVSLAILSSLLFQEKGSSLFDRDPEIPVVISSGTIKTGDTLAKILSDFNIPSLFIYKIQTSFSEVFNLRHMKPNDVFEIVTSTDGIFMKLVYRPNPVTSYRVIRSSSGVYTAEATERQTVWLEKRVEGTIHENMYKDLLEQGYDESFVANLVEALADTIFAWRIDFFTEQRKGDKFAMLLEQEFLVSNEKPLRNLKILAAYYEGSGTRDKENYAIRYQSPGSPRPDYFDKEGKAVRKAFLRAPFTYGSFRISSHFNPRRFHPIRRTYRPHHGTDYAAARGTRVVSIGNGTVTHAGWEGAYGNLVEIRHNHKYTSRYGHLSKIGVKKGQKIAQGQFIGNVGSTGLSTGPHLHFEMMVDGSKRNFLRLDFPSAKSVVAQDMNEFNRVRDQYLAHLMPQKPASTQLSSIPKK